MRSLPVEERIADRVYALVGSGPFVVIQSLLLGLWIFYNSAAACHLWHHRPFDRFPFILLNLTLSFQAAYTGPFIIMSQKRQAEKDQALLLQRLADQEALLLTLLARLKEP